MSTLTRDTDNVIIYVVRLSVGFESFILDLNRGGKTDFNSWDLVGFAGL